MLSFTHLLIITNLCDFFLLATCFSIKVKGLDKWKNTMKSYQHGPYNLSTIIQVFWSHTAWNRLKHKPQFTKNFYIVYILTIEWLFQFPNQTDPVLEFNAPIAWITSLLKGMIINQSFIFQSVDHTKMFWNKAHEKYELLLCCFLVTDRLTV